MVPMNRVIDKIVVFAGCLAVLAACAAAGGAFGMPPLETYVGASVVAMLAAAIVAAGSEALPERFARAAPLAYLLAAPTLLPGALFLPLTAYDIVRTARGGALAVAGAGVLLSFTACITIWKLAAPTVVLVAAAAALAGALAYRTQTARARQRTLNRMRDDLTQRERRSCERVRELELELERAHAAAIRSAGAGQTGAVTRVAGAYENATAAARGSVGHAPGAGAQRGVFGCLTAREFEVARLIADGLDNREIAAAAFMSEGTVRNHISSILAKTHLTSRTQIAIAYWRT